MANCPDCRSGWRNDCAQSEPLPQHYPATIAQHLARQQALLAARPTPVAVTNLRISRKPGAAVHAPHVVRLLDGSHPGPLCAVPGGTDIMPTNDEVTCGTCQNMRLGIHGQPYRKARMAELPDLDSIS